MSEIAGLASQFTTQNCLGYYSKLNLDSKFHSEVATYHPQIKLRIPYTLKIMFEKSLLNCYKLRPNLRIE